MEELLEFINADMTNIGVPYEFLEWTQPVTYPYFVGEYNELEPNSECNEEEKTFILTGFCRGPGSRLALERMRAKLEKEYDSQVGKIVTLKSKSVVAIFYSMGFFVPTGEEDLYKLQVNLNLKLWKVK